ncbi:TetR family transcriptional regulator [Antribacter sp. KLBMP9083]|uniref:TetR family transcriptional regulator n=1 Tax=Antribacter soli TaxID=2910976 RepID=A0AA41QCL1_9MICO|nr:TetR family transcriptional regulator [Antribacter soli]MCF4120970.1 TetR family transcriptional regulator [Antribacter soli]
MFKTAKAEATRELLRSTALRLFRDDGYERTTMRRVAAEAGVSTGNAYYYFPSKDDLVHELYREVQADHARLVAERLGTTPDAVDSPRPSPTRLEDRLRLAWQASVEAFEPYHVVGTELVSVAIRPGARTSPFSAESTPARTASRAVFAEVVAGAHDVPPHLRADLPELLWYGQLGLTLFWVHDTSPGRRRSLALASHGAQVVARLVRLARLPIARGVTDDVLRLVRLAASDATEGSGS